jgi:outer membrane protein OmpA-like peptidoglycan-associated protein
MKYVNKLFVGAAVVFLSACSMTEPWQGDSPKGLHADEKLLTPMADEQVSLPQEGKISFVQKKQDEDSQTKNKTSSADKMSVPANDEEEKKVVTVTQRVSQTVTLTADQVSARDENNYGDSDDYVVETKTFYPPRQTAVLKSDEKTASSLEKDLKADRQAFFGHQELASKKEDSSAFVPDKKAFENENTLLMVQIDYPLYESDLTQNDKKQLKDVVPVFKTGARKVLVAGYASYRKGDSVATQKMNISLAIERAEKTAKELVLSGIREENIEIRSFVVLPTGFGKGRRTEVYLEF